jgi:hypothetical protein
VQVLVLGRALVQEQAKVMGQALDQVRVPALRQALWLAVGSLMAGLWVCRCQGLEPG